MLRTKQITFLGPAQVGALPLKQTTLAGQRDLFFNKFLQFKIRLNPIWTTLRVIAIQQPDMFAHMSTDKPVRLCACISVFYLVNLYISL